jgi:hypothetical protein
METTRREYLHASLRSPCAPGMSRLYSAIFVDASARVRAHLFVQKKSKERSGGTVSFHKARQPGEKIKENE